jgi:hypothetical protein
MFGGKGKETGAARAANNRAGVWLAYPSPLVGREAASESEQQGGLFVRLPHPAGDKSRSPPSSRGEDKKVAV